MYFDKVSCCTGPFSGRMYVQAQLAILKGLTSTPCDHGGCPRMRRCLHQARPPSTSQASTSPGRTGTRLAGRKGRPIGLEDSAGLYPHVLFSRREHAWLARPRAPAFASSGPAIPSLRRFRAPRQVNENGAEFAPSVFPVGALSARPARRLRRGSWTECGLGNLTSPSNPSGSLICG